VRHLRVSGPHLNVEQLTVAMCAQPSASAVHEESARIEAAFRKYCEALLLLILFPPLATF